MKYEDLKKFVINKLKKELKPTLYYHNYKHTLDLCKIVEEIGYKEGVSDEEMEILKTAALLHDTGFLWQYDDNEELACDFAKNTLPDYNYNNEQIEKICDIILATKMPQKPTNKLEKIICDADLYYLGRDDFFITALKLHKEWGENSTKKITFKDWYLKQKAFLLSHNFFTKTAKEMLNEKKQENLLQIEELLSLLESSTNK